MWGAPDQSQVTITGQGFGSTPGSVQFFYQNGQPDIGSTTETTTPIVSWSDTQIVCAVPIGIIAGYPGSAGSGPLYVNTAAGMRSAGYPFTVTFAADTCRWPASRCYYRLNMNAEQAAAVRAAANSWNATGTPFQFVNTGSCATQLGSNGYPPREMYNDVIFAPAGDDGRSATPTRTLTSRPVSCSKTISS